MEVTPSPLPPWSPLYYKNICRVPFGEPPKDCDVLWRAHTQRYSVTLDAEAERYGTSDPEVQLFWFPIHHRTPCGAWINGMGLPSDTVIRQSEATRKFVNLKRVKQYASETKLEALKQLAWRRRRQIQIYQCRLTHAKEELAYVEASIDQLTSKEK